MMDLPPYVLTQRDDLQFRFQGKEWKCQVQDKQSMGRENLVLVCIDEKEWKVLVKEPERVKARERK